MERNPNQKTALKKVFSIQNLVMMAALIAMQIILARYLSIQASDTLRISFESIPVILAGMWLGPIPGAIVAVIADFLGTILSGYGTWFPPLVLGPLSVGILSGVSTKYIFRSPLAETRDTWKVAVIVVTVGILNSFVFGLIGSTMYSILVAGNTTAFPVLMWTNLIQRLATKPLTIAVNAVAVTIVNRAVYKPVVRQILSRA
jgi:ECF transporter S component (folate family)